MLSFGILFDLIILTIYLALMYENAAIMLLVYMEAVLMIAGFLFLLYRRFTVKGKLAVPVGISEAGKENLVRITVNNKGLLDVNRAKALVVVHDTMGGRRRKYWMKLAELPRGESSFIRSIVFLRAGNYDVTLKKLRVYDLTGLLYRDIPVRSTVNVQVLPELHMAPVRVTMAVKNFYGEADVYDEHSPGHDNSELFQVREFQAGDRLQNVHWKLTAKQDELVVKERSLPKSCPVVLFLNARPGKWFGKRSGKWFGKYFGKQQDMLPYLEAAAGLSLSIMDAGCSHYIVWYDAEEADIRRIRVDDEESLFYFIGTLMKVRWTEPKEDIILRYGEKYRMEPYVWGLSLDESLTLKKGDDVLARYDRRQLEKSLAQVELVL